MGKASKGWPSSYLQRSGLLPVRQEGLPLATRCWSPLGGAYVHFSDLVSWPPRSLISAAEAWQTAG